MRMTFSEHSKLWIGIAAKKSESKSKRGDGINYNSRNKMEIQEIGNLTIFFISPIEMLIDEFNGSVMEFKALFKMPKTNTPIGNLQQQICNTSKSQFDIWMDAVVCMG